MIINNIDNEGYIIHGQEEGIIPHLWSFQRGPHTFVGVPGKHPLLHFKEIQHCKGDFIVLTAGHMIQAASLLKYFDSPSLLTTVNGVSHNAMFKSINRLLRRGLIDVKERKKRLRRFILTDKGLACIQSYIQWYNYTLALYNDSVHATN